jgi:hypothetical protein
VSGPAGGRRPVRLPQPRSAPAPSLPQTALDPQPALRGWVDHHDSEGTHHGSHQDRHQKTTAKKTTARKSTAKKTTTKRAPKKPALVEREPRVVLEDAGYAIAGVASDVVDFAKVLPSKIQGYRGQFTKTADQAPERVKSLAEEAPVKVKTTVIDVRDRVAKDVEGWIKSFEKNFDKKAAEGRKVAEQVKKDSRVQRILDQTGNTRSQVKGAVTSVVKTADVTVEAGRSGRPQAGRDRPLAGQGRRDLAAQVRRDRRRRRRRDPRQLTSPRGVCGGALPPATHVHHQARETPLPLPGRASHPLPPRTGRSRRHLRLSRAEVTGTATPSPVLGEGVRTSAHGIGGPVPGRRRPTSLPGPRRPAVASRHRRREARP